MKTRCEWAKDDLNIEYHDNEWGVPQHDDKKLFEFIIYISVKGIFLLTFFDIRLICYNYQ